MRKYGIFAGCPAQLREHVGTKLGPQIKKYDQSRRADGKKRTKVGIKRHLHGTLKHVVAYFLIGGGLKFVALFNFPAFF